MWKVAALLAAVLAIGALGACGGDGAEPGASHDATLMLDFVPNAAHAGLFTALERDLFAERGVRMTIRTPGDSTDAPRLLRTGRVDFAVLDIHDLGLARERGLDLVGIAGLVQRPLASVLSREVSRPRDLEGKRVGVTGLPSDDAVLDSVVRSDGGDPENVRRTTIGFRAEAALQAGRVDAATGFWNAEGEALRSRGVDVRVFKVDEFGAPAYPELVLTTSREVLERDPELVREVTEATREGIEAVIEDPEAGLQALLTRNRGLDADVQRRQLKALEPVLAPAGALDEAQLRAWARWDVDNDILERPPDIDEAFRLGR
ncbi:MAG: ABC transporter substrate-binding protein [Solirubrobacterales bacterium]